MTHCISPKHSEFFNYPKIPPVFPVWEVPLNQPCTGTKAPKRIYFNEIDKKYYNDHIMTQLTNGAFFMSLDNMSPYVILVNGIMQETHGCPVDTGALRKTDMGTPTDISRFGNLLLAAYAEHHVVMLYDTNEGTDPIGKIVAGELNAPQMNPYESSTRQINCPMLVQWRDTGDHFAVYSGGAMKSIKVFDKIGRYISGCDQTGSSEQQWVYKPEPDNPDLYFRPNEEGTIIDALTAKDNELNNFWIPTTLQFVQAINNTKFDTILMGMYRKTPDGENWHRIYAMIPAHIDYFGNSNSLTGMVVESTGYKDGDVDLIRGFAVTKKIPVSDGIPTHNSYEIRMTIVSPRAWSVGGNDRYRHYELNEFVMWTTDFRIMEELPDSLKAPLIRPRTFTYKGRRKINQSSNNIWINNVKAEVVYNNNKLIVCIKSSDYSLWDTIKNNVWRISVESLLAGAGIYLWLSTTGKIVTGFLLKIIGSFLGLSWSPMGIAIVVMALVAFFILKPPKIRTVGTSMLTCSYPGDVTTYGWQSGSYEAHYWINSDLRRWRTIFTDQDINSDNIQLYSMLGDGTLVYGNWNSSTSEGVVLQT